MIEYARGLWLDLYIAGADGGPCIINLHGGGFTHGKRDAPNYVTFCNHLAAASGVTVAGIDYHLNASFPTPLDDVYAATAQLGKRDYGPFALVGCSAGAILAATAAACAVPDHNYRAFVAISGALHSSHFVDLKPSDQKAAAALLGVSSITAPTKADKKQLRLFLVENNIASAPPSLFVQGGLDVKLVPGHAMALSVALGGRSQIIVDPLFDHGLDVGEAHMDEIAAFLKRELTP